MTVSNLFKDAFTGKIVLAGRGHGTFFSAHLGPFVYVLQFRQLGLDLNSTSWYRNTQSTARLAIKFEAERVLSSAHCVCGAFGCAHIIVSGKRVHI